MDEENTTTAAAAAAGEGPETAGQSKNDDESTAAAAQEKNDNATTDDGEDTGGADAPADDTKDAASSGRPKRVRKASTNYVPEEETKKEVAIPDGKGEKLEDMPNVVAKFGDVTWSTPCLKSLYSIVFGVGKRADFKKHLLQFNGFSFSEDKEDAEFEKVTQKMYKLKLDQLKEVMDLCDIDRSTESFGGKKNPDKDMLCTRFLEWLKEPKASGKKLKGASKKAPAKRKSSSSATAKAPKKKPPAKKTKKEAPKPKKKKQTVAPADDDEEEVNIPGVSTDKIRSKIESIVANADKDSVTVKDVRKKLEDWLDMDLVEYKNSIRALVMDVM
eukprot:CAMPEP_0201718884 /NCGR_PEP_ID=MMETSP0593-20130828/4296_1 /ASSEMBLY_ACC=CAM_ASM_000672 /TAXON_ID=267983 /ORGANISM="Skeletonema japonicum, Strain CCMP2506" /LENGTH=329 /DNA_ID=CAMNT_0048209271 /DNA_START=80 /DNA_END=1069 /DNA_ORIENTATION=-